MHQSDRPTLHGAQKATSQVVHRSILHPLDPNGLSEHTVQGHRPSSPTRRTLATRAISSPTFAPAPRIHSPARIPHSPARSVSPAQGISSPAQKIFSPVRSTLLSPKGNDLAWQRRRASPLPTLPRASPFPTLPRASPFPSLLRTASPIIYGDSGGSHPPLQVPDIKREIPCVVALRSAQPPPQPGTPQSPLYGRVPQPVYRKPGTLCPPPDPSSAPLPGTLTRRGAEPAPRLGALTLPARQTSPRTLFRCSSPLEHEQPLDSLSDSTSFGVSSESSIDLYGREHSSRWSDHLSAHLEQWHRRVSKIATETSAILGNLEQRENDFAKVAAISHGSEQAISPLPVRQGHYHDGDPAGFCKAAEFQPRSHRQWQLRYQDAVRLLQNRYLPMVRSCWSQWRESKSKRSGAPCDVRHSVLTYRALTKVLRTRLLTTVAWTQRARWIQRRFFRRMANQATLARMRGRRSKQRKTCHLATRNEASSVRKAWRRWRFLHLEGVFADAFAATRQRRMLAVVIRRRAMTELAFFFYACTRMLRVFILWCSFTKKRAELRRASAPRKIRRTESVDTGRESTCNFRILALRRGWMRWHRASFYGLENAKAESMNKLTQPVDIPCLWDPASDPPSSRSSDYGIGCEPKNTRTRSACRGEFLPSSWPRQEAFSVHQPYLYDASGARVVPWSVERPIETDLHAGRCNSTLS